MHSLNTSAKLGDCKLTVSHVKHALIHLNIATYYHFCFTVYISHSHSSLPELNDDILMHIFSYLGLKDVIKIERGTLNEHREKQ